MNFEKFQLCKTSAKPTQYEKFSLFSTRTELYSFNFETYLNSNVCFKKVFQRNSDFEISGLAISEKLAVSKLWLHL